MADTRGSGYLNFTVTLLRHNNRKKAASLCPSLTQRQISKQQGTLKCGCSLVVKHLLCTPPWPSVQDVKGGKSSRGALPELVSD